MTWGIIGYGEIAPLFIEGLEASKYSELVSIASISSYEYLLKKALYGKVQIYDSYEDLLNEEVDIVYICTTNNLHFDNVLMAIRAGKHVLCEKPLTPSLNKTKELIKTALENNVLLMEGMWTRFLPAYQEALRIIRSGEIGTPKLVVSDFGFYNDWVAHRRLLNQDLYGGTLLDNADYNIFLSQDVFQEFPSEISAQATIAETGVEDACSILLKYPSGGMAQLYSSFRCETQQDATIYCEKGYIKLYKFWHGTKIEVKVDGVIRNMEYPFQSTGFQFEVDAMEDTIAKEKIENDIVAHSMSCDVAAIIDEVKRIIKV